MTKIADLPSQEKRNEKKRAEARASLDIAISVEKANIAKWKARIEQLQGRLAIAETRLRQLETGEAKPPRFRKPKPGDHVAAPPAGSLTKTV